ncbi:hypothetical protein [uncultured Aquimarina sp.]|uniref:hypothetical protein n=1 Tax=uncultured Aquimarina sp. TaxID=575652 RepID=UPI00261F6E1C|nr:hypothetical protein [uncultured Aquimarina sp.]
MEVDLKSFVLGGKFGNIDLGLQKKQIEPSLVGKIIWLNNETKENSRIWKVDSFEFHFEDQLLIGIINDHVSEISSRDLISIKEKWVFEEKNITMDTLQNNLTKLSVDYQKTEDKLGLIHIRLDNGIYFTLESLKNDEYELVVFGKTKVQ